MTKRKIEILGIIIVFILSIFMISKVTKANVSMGGSMIESTGHLARFIAEYPDIFINAHYTELYNHEVGANSYEGYYDIDYKSAACFYHKQATQANAPHKIVNVIDFSYNNGYVVTNNGDPKTFTKELGALLYLINKEYNSTNALVTSTNKTSRQYSQNKATMHYLFHCDIDKVALGVNSDFYTNYKTDVDKVVEYTGLLSEAKNAGNSMISNATTLQKNETGNITNENRVTSEGTHSVIGPFSVSYSGDKPEIIIETSNNTWSSKYWQMFWSTDSTTNNWNSTNNTSIPNNGQAFYLYFEADLSTSSAISVTFKKEVIGYKARMILLNRNTGNAQQLAMYASIPVTYSNTISYQINTSSSLKIHKVNNAGENLKNVGFMVFNSQGKALLCSRI